MAVGENFAVGTRVRANKFHGTVVKVRPTHHSHRGKIPVDSGTTVKWFRPEQLKVESETLPLLGHCDVDGSNLFQSEDSSTLVVKPDSTDSCPECGAILSPAFYGSSGSLTCAYCQWSPPQKDTLKLISLEQTSIDPQRLQPHPENDRIYGEHEDVSTLVELIQQSGWIKPIVVSQRGRIISGHRRWKAALAIALSPLTRTARCTFATFDRNRNSSLNYNPSHRASNAGENVSFLLFAIVECVRVSLILHLSL